MKRYLVYVLAALLVLALLPAVALAEDYDVADEAALLVAIGKAQSGETIKLTASFTVNVSQLGTNKAKFELPGGVTVDGDNHTITVTGSNFEGGASYAKGMLFQISNDQTATIKNLTIEGGKVIKHALQAWNGGTLNVEGVTVNNCAGYALVVNSATGVVDGLTTSGNGWGGINVDNGTDIFDKKPSLTVYNATIWDENSVFVENKEYEEEGALAPEAKIVAGSFQEVKVNKDQNVDNTCLSVSGGEFTKLPTECVEDDMTAARLGNKTYVGDAKEVAEKVKDAKNGQTIRVLTGNLDLTGVPAGVTVTNQGSGNVTVNGVSVGENESYTKPTKPIAGVVIGGGNQQEDEDEPEQSPSNTLRYAVICRTLNVRSGPGTEYSKLGTLSRGTLLDGELLSNGWVKFSYNGQTAYVSGVYVQSVDNGQLSVQCGTLNVRSGAGTSYSKIGALYRGTYVKPLETQGNWYKIGYDGGYGWICADYVG